MSLKGFHILFITMATALTLAFGWWSLQAYRATESAGFAVTAAGAAIAAVALVVYGVVFYRKLGKWGSA